MPRPIVDLCSSSDEDEGGDATLRDECEVSGPRTPGKRRRGYGGHEAVGESGRSGAAAAATAGNVGGGAPRAGSPTASEPPPADAGGATEDLDAFSGECCPPPQSPTPTGSDRGAAARYKDFVQPAELAAALQPYQRVGVGWMSEQEQGADAGGILADEMGLGKTVQAVALMLKNTPAGRPVGEGRLRTLVVVTASLLEQWKKEVEWLSKVELHIRKHHGPDRTESPLELAKQDVVITS